MIRDHGQHNVFASSAARYLLVLGLLSQAEGSPLQIDIDKRTRWRHVRIDLQRQPVERELMLPAPAPHPDGRVEESRPVSGHLKRQRYGEGRALVKWIYVQGYAARRWFARRWIVSKRGEPT